MAPQEYALRHIEFHAPSETRVNNVQFAFEMHFLLSTEGGDSMVRAMLFHSWPIHACRNMNPYAEH